MMNEIIIGIEKIIITEGIDIIYRYNIGSKIEKVAGS